MQLINSYSFIAIYSIAQIRYWNYIEYMNQNEGSFYLSRIKIIFLGDPTVGKTSIISAIQRKQFQSKQQPTVGIDFFAQIVNKNSKCYKLQFWDTAGQERFRSIIPSYIRNANIGVIVFDVTNRASYDNIHSWIQIFRQNSPANSKIAIVGNKIDGQERQVGKQQATNCAEKEGIKYIELSARTKLNIEELTSFFIMNIEQSQNSSEKQMQAKSYAKIERVSSSKQIKSIKLSKQKHSIERFWNCCSI